MLTRFRWAIAGPVVAALLAFGNSSKAGTVYDEVGSTHQFCFQQFCTFGSIDAFLGSSIHPSLAPGHYEYQLLLSDPSSIPSFHETVDGLEESWLYVDGVRTCCDVTLSDGLGNSVTFFYQDHTVNLTSSVIQPVQTPVGWEGYFDVRGEKDNNLGTYFGHTVTEQDFLYLEYVFNGNAVGPTDYRFIVTLVPEPAPWVLMMTGFGLVGAALRRHRALIHSQGLGPFPSGLIGT
jgi:hypothetical protein